MLVSISECIILVVHNDYVLKLIIQVPWNENNLLVAKMNVYTVNARITNLGSQLNDHNSHFIVIPFATRFTEYLLYS